MTDILAQLSAPFPPDKISWRVGSTNGDKSRGMALAYIDARDVQDRLNEVCGANWQVRHPWASGSKLACEIGIKIGEEWIWRGDGAGESDVEAEKGAFSDSFKRAAVRWGIGRYLYDIDSPWVELKQAGRSHVIAEHEYSRLRKLLEGKSAPARAAAASPKPVPSAAPAHSADNGADPLKALAEQIAKRIRTAPDVFRLDTVMDDAREEIAKLPRVTQEYLQKLYADRLEAMTVAA